jgi:catalase-peroxidase
VHSGVLSGRSGDIVADLFILAGNFAIESMGGGPVYGFGGRRADVSGPERDICWGQEDKWVNEGSVTRIRPDDKRWRPLHRPVGQVQRAGSSLLPVHPVCGVQHPHRQFGFVLVDQYTDLDF